MTIGIAATGPWAGAGILAGLRAVEAVGRGSIGGFVSLAVLTQDQKLLRAETQTGGTKGLFAHDPPEQILRAPLAALISSGPDRPTPLSQFVAAAPEVGLVTGHRFPQALDGDQHPLNAKILEAMRSGTPPQQAIDDLIAVEPGFDAGFIALSRSGALGLGNMPSVLRRADLGSGIRSCEEIGASVATLHNAIQPNKAIALLSGEAALDAMRMLGTTQRTIKVAAGLYLSQAERPEIHVDDDYQAIRILHPDTQGLEGDSAFGMGDRVRVIKGGAPLGWLGHEPFMVVKDGRIVTLDGKVALHLPVLVRGA